MTAVLAAVGTSFIREILMLDHTKLTGVSQSGEGVFLFFCFFGRKEQVEIKCLELLKLEGVRDRCN